MTVMPNPRSNLPDYKSYNKSGWVTLSAMAAILDAILNFGEVQRYSWGLLVCCSTHIPGPILENSACYEIFPGLALFSSDALGLFSSLAFSLFSSPETTRVVLKRSS